LKIHLTGDIQSIEAGIQELSRDLGIELSDQGIPIEVKQKQGDLEVSLEKGQGTIRYDKPIHFFRAIGLWVEDKQTYDTFHKVEKPQFESNGIMVDASRNAVLTVDAVKLLLRKMALMGLNVAMLYTEDTYTIDSLPYFGYMRGRYSTEELKACDDYAFQFGIEMIPCIQTLAHLSEALKWNYAAPIRDTEDILLAGSSETYEFIEKMLSAASKPFRSKKIHIGMDEAHQLGLGKYLEKNGYQHRFDIMNAHLQRVSELSESLGLEPMIWSDMYFRLGSQTGNYYDLESEIPQEVMDRVPKNVDLVYWDYYKDDESFYSEFIRKHQAFGSDPIFAGGVWTWNGIAPNYGKTIVTTEAALSACKKEGIRHVFATMWGDNGAETSIITALPGMQLFAEHGYAVKVDRLRLEKRYTTCVSGSFEDFLALNEFDETPGVSENNMKESNPSKYLLWQDVLIGLYDNNIQGLPMNQHYAKLNKRMVEAKKRNPKWQEMFGFYEKLALVLSQKSEMGIHIKQAYDEGNRTKLVDLIGMLEQLQTDIDDLRKKHRRLWLSTNKPFGWEVLDIRYGGVLVRLETTVQRIQDYVDGHIQTIEELDAERLYFDAPWVMPEGTLGRGAYHRIVTAGTFSG
jgi:hexosaminidase